MAGYDSELAGARVVELLGKADTALQSVPDGYVTEDALAMVATTGNYSDLNDKPNVHIIDLTGDAASVHSYITEAYNTSNPIFFSRPPGIFGPDYYPCKVEDLDGYFKVYMSLVRSPGSITIFSYIVLSTEIIKENVAEIAITNNLNSDGPWNTLELSMIGDGTQVLANNGSYTALKSINGASIIGSGDIEIASVSESTVSEWGFTKNEGTITGITMNGASKGSSGVVDLGTVITSHQDISGKQDKLISGTNIKTINGNSILGEGDIAVGADNSGKLEEVFVTPVISDTTATYKIPAGVVAYCDTSEVTSGITSVVLDLDFSSLEKETLYQFHIMYPDDFSQSLSIGSSQDTSMVSYGQGWPNNSAPTLSATGGFLEISIIAALYTADDNLYTLELFGAWSNLMWV